MEQGRAREAAILILADEVSEPTNDKIGQFLGLAPTVFAHLLIDK